MNTNAACNPQILRLILRSSRRSLPQQRCSCIRLHLRTGPRYAMAASVASLRTPRGRFYHRIPLKIAPYTQEAISCAARL